MFEPNNNLLFPGRSSIVLDRILVVPRIACFHIWRGGRVAMQRTATPCTPVRFRLAPPNEESEESGQCGCGGIGRHKGLKIPRLNGRAGSSPATRTTFLFHVVSY